MSSEIARISSKADSSIEKVLHHERNLVTRLIVGFLGAPLILFIVYSGGALFTALLAVIGVGGLLEFRRMVVRHPGTARMTAFGILYIGLPLCLAVWLRALPEGLFWTACLLLTNWMTDTAAYFGGRLFGRRPLAPRISPNKTLEGALTGWIAGALVGLLVLLVGSHLSARTVLFPILVALAVILGDLFESALKRHYAIKDASQIIPGHGGILDRIDGTLFALLVAAVYLLVIGVG